MLIGFDSLQESAAIAAPAVIFTPSPMAEVGQEVERPAGSLTPVCQPARPSHPLRRISMASLINEVGNKYGRLTVSRYSGDSKYECICECGEVIVTRSADLRRGKSTSCGCARSEALTTRNHTHRLSKHPAYKSYHQAKYRCSNPNNEWFHRYGGRGIQFLLPSFEDFWAVMMRSWFDGATLGRQDNDGDYELSNVRWETKAEQTLNRSCSVKIEFKGITKNQSQWANDLGITSSDLIARLKHHPIEIALTMPKRITRRTK